MESPAESQVSAQSQTIEQRSLIAEQNGNFIMRFPFCIFSKEVARVYRIADLNVRMPEVGDMPERMKHYEISAEETAEVVIRADELRPETIRLNSICQQYYLETGKVFYKKLLSFDGMMLHASAVAMDGCGYLFSGPCGMGKSTHTQLYLREFGNHAEIINDDKPAMRRIGDTWYVYGTPWCGKDGINVNRKVRLGGICFLRRGDTSIRRLSPQESVRYILGQTQHRLERENMIKLMGIVDKLAREVPIFELFSHAEPSDAHLSYTEMTKAIREAER